MRRGRGAFEAENNMNRSLTFGLSSEQEDRYRRSCLAADLGQARIGALLILAPVVGFLFNDYSFFGFSWPFYGLTVLRLGLLVHTVFLVHYAGRVRNYRSYDRAALAWGLVLVLSVVAIHATRPPAFLAHAVVVVVVIFLFSLGIPNRFINQVILSTAVTLGEAALILVRSQPPSSQATLAILISLLLANTIALSASWQFNSYRRKAFAAGEKEQAALEALRDSEERMRRAKEDWEKTFDTVPDFVAILDDQQHIVRANRPMAAQLGVTPEQCVGLHCYEAVHGASQPPDFCPHVQTCRDGREHIAEVYEPRLGGHFLVSTTPRFDEQGRFIGSVHVARDITKRKRDEEEREIAAGFLRLVNESRGKEELVRSAVTFFQQKSGCEAVGIRLKKGDDYPYYETRGFPQKFVLLENCLCARNDAGEPIRDGSGDPLMECMCGNVICGRYDPAKPFFTARGSFWTNSTTDLLASTTDADRRARTRNRCNGEGYESVALIALSVGGDCLGLFQMNDRRKGRFTAEAVALWERLAGYLAVALAKTQAEEALRQSERRVRLKLESILSPEGDIGKLDLADVIDAPAIQSLMDHFYKLAGIPVAIIDLEGKVMVGAGWQDVCTKFHRVNPKSRQHCIESDTQLSAGVAPGEFKLYKCKNAMWDVATPITVGGRHVGNVFTGQFFFDDEPVDYEAFRRQARRYGFDEQPYLAALEAVPRLSRSSVEAGMGFFASLAQMLSLLSYSNIKLARSLAERDALIAERKQSEARIRASLAEKEVLLKEIHHRVKNNMQVISSLVALQAERLPDAAMREVLQDVTHRVRSMALVHEKLYQSADMARVEFAEYAQSLLDYLWRTHGTTASGVRLALDLEPVPLSVNAAVPCGLILNELVSNALKHAFRDRAGGEVAVSLRGGPQGRVCLRVRDNGTGLPAGFDWRQADSLGLHLVQMLAGQLHATVEVSSKEGTEFAVTFDGPKTMENGRS